MSYTARVKINSGGLGRWILATGGGVGMIAAVWSWLAAGTVPSAPLTAAVAAPPVRDIVLITIDTLRADALGFSGNQAVATPHLDRLAEEGWVFDRAHAHNVVTLPSHANIITGRLPFEHGVRENSGFRLPDGMTTVASILKQHDFATGAFVAAAPLDARYGLGQGFDVYDDSYPRGSDPTSFVMAQLRGDEVIDRGIDWWRQNEGSRRFLWVHLYDPHAPYSPEPRFAVRHREHPYNGEIEATDHYVGRLLEPLWSQPDLLVVFTADHGEALGEHGEATHGLFAYEETLRVPLVLWRRGLTAQRTESPAQHIDLLPSMLAAAGVPIPPDLQGRSLWDPIADPGRVSTYFESLTPALNQGWAPLRGVLRGDFKYIELPIPELYDLAADPRESRNLHGSRPELARELSQLLPVESVWPPEKGTVSDEEAQMLEALGYAVGPAPPRKSEFGPKDDPKNLVHLSRKLHEVTELYHLRRLQEAARLGQEILAERPDMGIAYSYVTQVLLEMGQTSQAITLMEQARKLGVASDAVLRQLGLSLASVGRTREAVELLAPYRDSDDPDFLRTLGQVLSEAGRQNEAERILLDLLTDYPNDPVARQYLALVYLRRQRWAEAAEQARVAVGINPQLDLAWNYLGTARYNLGQPREALEAWDRALTILPDNPDVLFNVSVVAAAVGDVPKARQALERFIAVAPPDRYGPDIEQAKLRLRQLGG